MRKLKRKSRKGNIGVEYNFHTTERRPWWLLNPGKFFAKQRRTANQLYRQFLMGPLETTLVPVEPDGIQNPGTLQITLWIFFGDARRNSMRNMKGFSTVSTTGSLSSTSDGQDMIKRCHIFCAEVFDKWDWSDTIKANSLMCLITELPLKLPFSYTDTYQ